MTNSSPLPDIPRLAKNIKGKILLPTDPAYAQSCTLFNRAVRHRPALLVQVRNPKDIRAALEYARHHKLKVSVKGGGHSACGSCLHSGALVIDTSALKQIKITAASKRIRIGAGALNYEVDSATQAQQLSMPLGTCPTVGVVGSTLGGGIGLLSRKFGLLSDNVEQISMINAAGETMQIDQHQHPELFWALRGAGANQFGIVTSMVYRLQSIPDKVYGGLINWPIKYAKEVLKRYRDLMASSTDDLFLYAFIPSAKKSEAVVSVLGCYFSDIGEGKKLFDAIEQWAPACSVDVSDRSYWSLQQTQHQEELAVYWKHGIVSQTLSDDAIDLIVDCFQRCPDNAGGIMLDPLGGAINRVDKSASAFIHRDGQYICSFTGLHRGEFMPKAVSEWVRSSYESLSPSFNGYAYQNFEDSEIDQARCYYGEHVDRLKALKTAIDPDSLFVGTLSDD